LSAIHVIGSCAGGTCTTVTGRRWGGYAAILRRTEVVIIGILLLSPNTLVTLTRNGRQCSVMTKAEWLLIVLIVVLSWLFAQLVKLRPPDKRRKRGN